MKKILKVIICYMMFITWTVKAQVVTVEANFKLDVDLNKIDKVLMLIKDSNGVEHVVETDYSNNYKANVIIADGEYLVLSYTVSKDYSKNYPINVNINKDVYPNVITMNVSKKNSILTTTTTEIDNTTSTTTTSNIESTREDKKKNSLFKMDSYTIVIISIPIIAFTSFVLYGVYKYIKTIR